VTKVTWLLPMRRFHRYLQQVASTTVGSSSEWLELRTKRLLRIGRISAVPAQMDPERLFRSGDAKVGSLGPVGQWGWRKMVSPSSRKTRKNLNFTFKWFRFKILQIFLWNRYTMRVIFCKQEIKQSLWRSIIYDEMKKSCWTKTS